MPVNPGVWGIDIGQCALKALRLEQVNGVVTATAFDYVEHPKILSQPDANPDELTREALANFVTFDLLKRGGIDGEVLPAQPVGKKKCVVALDIGTDGSNLIITDGARIIWQRPIPVGGNHFTRALTKELKLTFAKAEHLKRNAVKSPELKKILAALKPVLNDFVGEVQRSLGYFTNTHRDANIQYMIGLGNAFRLPGIQKYLQEKLQLEVRKLQVFDRVQGDEVLGAPQFSENIMTFAVPYGLSLQALKQTKLQPNLLLY